MNSKKTYTNLGKILERDSKSASYKFALLRGAIEIVLERSPYIQFEEGRVAIPAWLLVEKWLIYYYPILEHEKFIPQLTGERLDGTQISFRQKFLPIIEYYRSGNGLSQFYSDLRSGAIPEKLETAFVDLSDCIYQTSTKQPMRYIGGSLKSEATQSDGYLIFNYERYRRKKKVNSPINSISMLARYGDFYFPLPYYELFEIMGSFILGSGSILQRWAEFTVNLTRSTEELTINQILEILNTSPVEERNIGLSNKLLTNLMDQEGMLTCVWSGRKIKSKKQLNLDHLIPFSAWKNNDLWNLLPADASVNNKKRDKIPSIEVLKNSKGRILHYWTFLESAQRETFMREAKHSLLGEKTYTDWKEASFQQLKKSCNHLIQERGYEPWNG